MEVGTNMDLLILGLLLLLKTEGSIPLGQGMWVRIGGVCQGVISKDIIRNSVSKGAIVEGFGCEILIKMNIGVCFRELVDRVTGIWSEGGKFNNEEKLGEQI